MPKPILIISAVHDYRMKRRGSLQALADALRDQGEAVTFLSLRFSWLSGFRHDPRCGAIKPNCVIHHNGIDCFLWRTAFHPFGTRFTWLNFALTPLFWLYACWPNCEVDRLIRAAGTIIVESGLGITLTGRIRRLNPTATLIYRASDRLSTIGQHPVVAQTLRAKQRQFSHFALLGSGMAVDFEWAFPRAVLVPATVDSRLLTETGGPTPFRATHNAVCLGPMLFDPTFFAIAGPLFPDVVFHVFGVPAPSDPRLSNVNYRPEVAFADTFPYLRHATIGIAPYRAGPDIGYLTETRGCGDSHGATDVIHAADGPRCADGRSMGEDRPSLFGQADRPWA